MRKCHDFDTHGNVMPLRATGCAARSVNERIWLDTRRCAARERSLSPLRRHSFQPCEDTFFLAVLRASGVVTRSQTLPVRANGQSAVGRLDFLPHNEWAIAGIAGPFVEYVDVGDLNNIGRSAQRAGRKGWEGCRR